VLAIIAYKQPITRPQIEAIRGVDCSGIVQNLLERQLIEPAGRLEAPGRPTLYTTTSGFLQHFGLRNIDDLAQAQK
jgi:segregation and condensation protein B